MLWPYQSGLKKLLIANARGPAVLSQLLFVYREKNLGVDPDPTRHYFASSRSALRRFFMMARATFIWAAKSGLWAVILSPSGVSER
jgi:hypothetical protein